MAIPEEDVEAPSMLDTVDMIEERINTAQRELRDYRIEAERLMEEQKENLKRA